MVAIVIDHPFGEGVIPSPYNPDPALLAIVEIIRVGLIRDQHVRLHQFGTFRLRWSKERRVKHPKTGENIAVAPAPRITFTPAKQLSEWIEPNRKPVVPLNGPLNDPLTEPVKIDSIPAQTRSAESIKTPHGIDKHQVHSDTSLQETMRDIMDEQYSLPENLSDITNPRADPQPEAPIINNPEEPQKSGKKWALGLLAAVPLILFLLQSDFSNETSGVQKSLPIETQTEAQTKPVPALNNAVISNQVLRAENLTPDNQQSDSVSKPSTQVTARTEPAPRPFYMSPQVHTIQQGENLWNLAKQFYGDALLWPLIYRANIRTLNNPDMIINGKDLVIPGLQQSSESLSKKDRELIAEGYFMVYQFNKSKGFNQSIYFLIDAKQFSLDFLQQKKSLISRKDWRIISKD